MKIIIPIVFALMFVTGIVLCVVSHITYSERAANYGLGFLLAGYLGCVFGLTYYMQPE
jgi:hypothetical protein